MAQHESAPKFGDWEGEEDVPYTAYFEKARKDRKGRDPEGSQGNPNVLLKTVPPIKTLSVQTEDISGAPSNVEVVTSKNERQASREYADQRRLTESTLHHVALRQNDVADSTQLQHEDGGSRSRKSEEVPKGFEALMPKHKRGSSREDNYQNASSNSLSNHGVTSSDTPRKATRNTAGSVSVEQSPLHPHHHARTVGRGSGPHSPSRERKSSSDGGSHGLAPSTPWKSRPRSVTRGDETPDHGAAVPKFGDWNENDPSSADGYSIIFSKVREERQRGASGMSPVMPNHNSHFNGRNYPSKTSKKCCCFPWGGK